MNEDTPDHPKQALRYEMKEVLSSFSQDLLLEKSDRVYHHLSLLLDDLNHKHHSTFSKSITIGAYAPIRGEVILAKLENDFVCAYPSFDESESEMIFRLSKLSGLKESFEFGVNLKTPSQDALLVKPDVILVPGLAFSKQKQRLGRGKGFYDRYLKKCIGVKIGICFDEQLWDQIPVEGHDQLMDYVVSDQGVINK